MTWINALLSTTLVLGLIAAALGYRHSVIHREYSPEWYFSLSKTLIALAFGIRLLFWDSIWGPLRAVDRDAAYAMSEAIGGANANLFPTMIGLVGVYCSLKARQLLIPEDERSRWPVLVAWAHPSLLGITLRRRK